MQLEVNWFQRKSSGRRGFKVRPPSRLGHNLITRRPRWIPGHGTCPVGGVQAASGGWFSSWMDVSLSLPPPL